MTNKLGRPVCQYTPENILINSFRSISEAGRLSGIKSNNIKSVLSGNTRKVGGFVWKYLDEKNLKA